MTEELTVNDLRVIRAELRLLASPSPSPWRVDLDAKIDRIIEARTPGPQCFRMELRLGGDDRARVRAEKKGAPKGPTLVWAPSLNEYNGLVGWQKAKLRKAMDKAILVERGRWARARCGSKETPSIVKGKVRISRSGGRRRLVVVTRYSSRRPDELSCDVLGGKMPIDRLVLAGVLAGDDDAALVREGRWERVPDGDGRVVVDVFELPGLPEVVRGR